MGRETGRRRRRNRTEQTDQGFGYRSEQIDQRFPDRTDWKRGWKRTIAAAAAGVLLGLIAGAGLYCFSSAGELLQDKAKYLQVWMEQRKGQGPDAWTEQGAPLIAHAGGGLLARGEDGKLVQYTYTNSLEALRASYEKGYRVIELDFRLSKDGMLCALHKWSEFSEEGSKKVKMSADAWKEQKIEGLYTALTLEDVLLEMAKKKDMYLVLDAKSYKWSDEEVEERYLDIYEKALETGGEQLARRIIPQIYEEREYDLVKSAYEWSSIIYTLYRLDDVPDEEILDFVCDKEDIAVVTVPTRRVTELFCEELHDAGKKVYTHTVNETDTLYEWMNLGVDGFYTDTVTPDAWQARYRGL